MVMSMHLERGPIVCALVIITLAVLAACSSPPPKEETPPPPKLRVEIAAAEDANRGPDGRGRAVRVRLYELKSQGTFTTTDYFSLFDREGAALGADLIAREEVTLAPGQRLPIERPLNSAAAYLGVVAAFYDIDHSRWRDAMRLKAEQDNVLLVEVGAKTVSIRFR